MPNGQPNISPKAPLPPVRLFHDFFAISEVLIKGCSLLLLSTVLTSLDEVREGRLGIGDYRSRLPCAKNDKGMGLYSSLDFRACHTVARENDCDGDAF